MTDQNHTTIQNINWNELILSPFDYNRSTNESDEETDATPTVIIPMRQVDTSCCVAIVPTDMNQNDGTATEKKKKMVIEDVPIDYTYHITVRAEWIMTDATQVCIDGHRHDHSCYAIEMYSTDVTTMEGTLQSLFQWFHGGHHGGNWNMTIQAFSQQPRQVLPSLWKIPTTTTTTTMTTMHPSHIRTLRICYCTITDTVWNWMEQHDSPAIPNDSSSNHNHFGVEAIEFIQCTIECDWNRVLSFPSLTLDTTTGSSDIVPPAPFSSSSTLVCGNQVSRCPCPRKAITLSCTLPEFIKFVAFVQQQEQNDSSNIMKDITELHFKLHFFLPDQPVMMNFSQAIATQCPALTTLSVQYLDLSDTGWNIFCTTLANTAAAISTSQLRSISLSYTDNFVDTYRRLTEERCTKRTRDIFDMVQAIPTIQDIHFPTYQQDASIMHEIQAILEERKKNGEMLK